MNFLKKIPLIILLLIFSLPSFSQTKKDNLSLNSGTIDSQFEFVIQKSYTYKGSGKIYKNVERHWLYTLKSHTLDSLKAVHKDLADTRLVVKKQDKEISDLKQNLSNTQSNLDKTNTEKNNMALFGMQMSKSSYNVLMWTIIAGLLALLILFIYKFKNSNAITKGAKHALAEIEEEFDEHRKTALEREQKVRRQLQDEINKQKGL
ncbi:tRNA (guanine-N1)-methyltransferase [Flavivirga spongiicola]|uniref:tRNA (Guanine-N1)-methyltransferase n=1 Tax=Flavivirga spongiicola TaxID=421621 RepID=A0ABU7XP14_9FLAO|nr:tRNA (guanine-N1)-methyltransferase [Flavivirga sp. MEBiC05379]MDO5977281.1 tRNA (guanine-N1)-methyltransferase [Flavivirga sp. MEBiC05379]